MCREDEGATTGLMLGLSLTLVIAGLAAPAVGAQTPAEPRAVTVLDRSEADVIGVEEVERGQRGYGVSVFAGTEPQRFDVEVVGVMRDTNPGMSFILARLEGQGLEDSGVVAGMSGSPVYFDDRLAGAVAFSWNFSTGALAGITPIADMRRLADLPEGFAAGSGPAPSLVGERSPRAAIEGLLERGRADERLAEQFRALFGAGPAAATGGEAAVRSWQWAASAVGPRLSRVFGSAAAAGGGFATVGRSPAAGAPSDAASLAGGSAVAGVLIGGDLNMTVTGTVTERRGDEVLAFGHPFLGIGPLSIPMAEAEVLTVVNSRFSSFKLSNVGPVVGAFDQDRLAGVRGRIGAIAPTTPMRVRVSGTAERAFDLEIADLEAIRPMLVAIAALQSLDAATRSAGDQGLDLRARFELAGYDDLEMRQTFDGGQAASEAAIFLLQVVALLELNPIADVRLERIELDLHHSDRTQAVQILRVDPARREVRPGEEVDLWLELRDYRGETRRQRQSWRIPEDTAPGPYHLFVGDGAAVDALKLQLEPPALRDLADTLAVLDGLHASTELAFVAARRGRGVVVQDQVLPALPGSMRSLLRSSPAAARTPVNLQVVGERYETQERPLAGVERVDLRVLPPRAAETRPQRGAAR